MVAGQSRPAHQLPVKHTDQGFYQSPLTRESAPHARAHYPADGPRPWASPANPLHYRTAIIAARAAALAPTANALGTASLCGRECVVEAEIGQLVVLAHETLDEHAAAKVLRWSWSAPGQIAF